MLEIGQFWLTALTGEYLWETGRPSGHYPVPAGGWSAAPIPGQVLREEAFRSGGSSDNWRNLPGSTLFGAFFPPESHSCGSAALR